MMRHSNFARISILILLLTLSGGIVTVASPLELSVNIDTSDLFVGDPVAFTVRLSNPAAVDAVADAANLAALVAAGFITLPAGTQTPTASYDTFELLTVDPPWHEALRFVLSYEMQGEVVSVDLGSEEVAYLSGTSSAETIGAQPLQATLSIRPELTAGLPAGAYWLQAIWDGSAYVEEEDLGEDGTLRSAESPFALTEIGTEAERAIQYHRLADFEFQIGDAEQAKQHALLALEIDRDAHLRAYYIVAEVFVIEGRLSEAISTYEEFQSLLPPQSETKAHDYHVIEERLAELTALLEGQS
jgi:hypothetical protein